MLQTMGASQGVPMFLKSLASSLQMLQLQQSTATPKATPTAAPLGMGNRTTTTTAGGDSVGVAMPAELFQMMDALKQMRPPSPPATAADQSMNREGEERAQVQEQATAEERTKAGTSEEESSVLDQRLSELERRLLGYVDSKIVELEKKILLKLDTLVQRIETQRPTQEQLNSSCGHSSVSNGVLPPAPLPEDTQLD